VIVVSDSSPLIALARVGRLSLLASLYERVMIPAEVRHEVTVAGGGLPGAKEVRRAGWIEVVAPRSPADPILEQACQGLGAGERGAILLAKALPADLVLLDEHLGGFVAAGIPHEERNGAGIQPGIIGKRGSVVTGIARPVLVPSYNQGEVGTMSHEYVEVREGGFYITGSRVSLASVIYAFRDGASPETIRQNFPSLSLAQVYGAIAFYLNHPQESEAYLQELKRKWEELERKGQPPSEELQQRLEQARQRLFAEQA